MFIFITSVLLISRLVRATPLLSSTLRPPLIKLLIHCLCLSVTSHVYSLNGLLKAGRLHGSMHAATVTASVLQTEDTQTWVVMHPSDRCSLKVTPPDQIRSCLITAQMKEMDETSSLLLPFFYLPVQPHAHLLFYTFQSTSGCQWCSVFAPLC